MGQLAFEFHPLEDETMKTKAIIALIAIVGTFGLAGCKPKTTTLTGQVFIVTQGGDNIKLGDVQILLIEKAQVAAFLAKRQPIVDAEIASAQQEFNLAKENSKNAYAAYKANEDLKNSGDDSQRNMVEALEQKWFAVDDNLKAVMKKLNDAQGVENYFSDFLPDSVQKTVSDADGKFSFTYLRDKPLAIYATATRTVPDELTDVLGGRQTITGVEKYYWLVDAPTNSEAIQIFLSNDNLVFSDPAGYFTIAPKKMPSNREFERAYNHVLLELEK